MSTKLGKKFYIDFSCDGERISQGTLGPFDANGIPMVDYNVRYHAAGLPLPKNSEFGLHYTPVTVSILALSLFDRIALESNGSVAKARFFELVEWLVDNLKHISPTAAVWQHHFSVPFKAGLPAPYSSGIAQALGICVLLRAFEMAGNGRYFDAATRAFASFYVDIEEGGVRSTDNGFIWIEEWPSYPRSHVLNGFMFAILAIHEYGSIFEGPEASELRASVLETLEFHIERYDANYGSRYDLLRGLVVTESYHKIHIRLLDVIYALSGNNIFFEVARRWEGYISAHGALKRRIMGFAENVIIDSEYRACKARQILRRCAI